VISDNHTGLSGGGVFVRLVDHDITFEDSTISGNTADTGGGIYFQETQGGTQVIRGTTLSNNSASRGGGIFFGQPNVLFFIENSTLSGNLATHGNGGGIYLSQLPAGITIRNTTIARNTASDSGGGIFLLNGTASLLNAIVGDNTANADNDLSSQTPFNLLYTLVESPGTASINDNGGNIFHQDPQLGILQNNGGPTWTQKPANASPVINAGDPAFIPPPFTDQRGFNRVSRGRIDLGAVELEDDITTIPTLDTLGQRLLAVLLGLGGLLRVRRLSLRRRPLL
jgi:parallel beta helix pectate lyase-like protein